MSMSKCATYQDYIESIKPEAAILQKMRSVKTMTELDALRPEVVSAMKAAFSREGQPAVAHLQNSFVSAQNRLRNAGRAA
jgi:hypothetical protein